MLRQLKHRISVLSGGSTIHDRPTKSIISQSHCIQSLVQLSFIYTSTLITEIIRRLRSRCSLVDAHIFTFSSQKIFTSSHLQLSVIFLIIFLYKQDKRVQSAGIQFIRHRLKFRSNSLSTSLSTATTKTRTKPFYVEFYTFRLQSIKLLQPREDTAKLYEI